MKTCKYFLSFIAALFFLTLWSTNVLAQGTQQKQANPETKAAKQTNEMVETLKLTTAQAKTVKEINLTYAKKIYTLKQNGKKKETREQVKKLKASRRAKINQVLTPAQQTRWAAIKKQQAAKKK